jgi:hypothetical protein
MKITLGEWLECWRHTTTTTEEPPPKPLTHEEIERQTADFLARGGKIEEGVSMRLQAEKLGYGGEESTTRRWVCRPPPRSPAEAEMTAKMDRYRKRGGKSTKRNYTIGKVQGPG